MNLLQFFFDFDFDVGIGETSSGGGHNHLDAFLMSGSMTNSSWCNRLPYNPSQQSMQHRPKSKGPARFRFFRFEIDENVIQGRDLSLGVVPEEIIYGSWHR